MCREILLRVGSYIFDYKLYLCSSTYAADANTTNTIAINITVSTNYAINIRILG